MTTTAQSVLARMCLEPGASPHTFDTNSEPFDLLFESLKKNGNVQESAGNRGSRSRSKHRRRNGSYLCSGMVVMDVTPRMLRLMLPRVLGAAAVGNVFSLADTLPSFGVLLNRVTTVGGGHFEYQDCKVDRCMIVGQSGSGNPSDPEYIRAYFHLVALDEVTGTAFPNVTLPTSSDDAAYVYGDSSAGVTLQGALRKPKRWALLINNFLVPRITNSFTPDQWWPADRRIGLEATFPFDDDHDDLHDIGTSGAAGSLVLTNGTLSTTFDFGWLDAPANSPNVARKRTEIDLTLRFLAGATDSADELVVTNDSTV